MLPEDKVVVSDSTGADDEVMLNGEVVEELMFIV